MAAGKGRPPDAARLAAVRILHAVLEEGAYANVRSIRLLDQAGLDARGRSFASALVYGTLSRIFTIDWFLSKISHKPLVVLDPWTRSILRMGAWQLIWSGSVPTRAAVDESVRLATELTNPGAASYVNAALRKLSYESPEIPAKNLPVKYSLSPELFGYLRKWYGTDEAEFLACSFLNEKIDVTARVNRLRTTTDQVAAALTENGIPSVMGRYCPEALRLDLGGSPVRGLMAWQEGLLTIQDEAAMLVGYAVSPKPGQIIIDLCAAPGGKTTHLAEMSDDNASILAFDSHPERLKLVEDNARRLGLQSISCRTGDATGKGMDPDLAGTADVVLADVPCSGLGLMARKPEIRLTMNHERIMGLYPLQASILDYAATLPKPGGILLYSTCTINPDENIERIRSFLDSQHGKFKMDSLSDLLPEAISAHADLAVSASEGWMQLLPHRHGLDGFFIARMRRI